MRKTNGIKGAGTALVTPFKNGKVDFAALTRIIEKQIEDEVDFLVALGTTGEASALTISEKKSVLSHIVRVTSGRVPLVAGMFGGNCTAAITHRFAEYNLSGYAAIMASSPAYVKPTQEGIFQHYRAIAKESPLPIIIYNVPGRTASNVLPETVVRLANASEKFIAVKEASGDLVQGAKILKDRPADFMVLSGDDPTAVPLLSCGADGCISVIGNALPMMYADMIHAGLRGDFAEASRLHLAMFDLHHWLYAESNPAGIKAALEILRKCEKEVRLPLLPLSERNYVQLKKELEKVKKTKKAIV